MLYSTLNPVLKMVACCHKLIQFDEGTWIEFKTNFQQKVTASPVFSLIVPIGTIRIIKNILLVGV